MFAEVLMKFLKKLFSKKAQKGAILIEFAFSVPIVIILLFFVMDGPLAYRIAMKMQKMSELTAQMIYNVTGNEDRRLNLNDLANISAASGITLIGDFDDIQKNKEKKRYPFYLSTYVFCVSGVGGNKFKINWIVHMQNALWKGAITVNNDEAKPLYSLIEDGAKSIISFPADMSYSDFAIQLGEVKLIVETVSWYKGDELEGTEGRGFNNGYYLLNIPGKVLNGVKTFGHRFAVITLPETAITESTPPVSLNDKSPNSCTLNFVTQG